ncbi:sensor histidine kinase [Hydrocarboniphaga effusa]|jgi:signal transduction histidine kinase|uniref:sensor histidine kinase n=1 Tax=Hydrocarboniphaga effusa TaxID=243629 RepID=UPI003BAB9B14
MIYRPSLKTRFVAALLGLVLIVCAGFSYAVHEFIGVLEQQLMEQAVKRELHEMADNVRAGRMGTLPHMYGMRGILWHIGEPLPAPLPSAVALWPNNSFKEITIERRKFYVGREDVGRTAVWVMLDMTQIETLKARLINIAYTAIATAIGAAILLGLLLSWIVVAPVRRLALQVAALRPEGKRIVLKDRFADPEIRLIADSVDRYQERIERFVTRERDFTSDASHELRNPLAVVASALPMLREEPTLSDAGQDRLQRIERATTQMKVLLDALLFLAREDGGHAFELCALDNEVWELVEQWRDAATIKGVSLTCEITHSLLIEAPPGMVACVVGNLLSNAIRHTHQGSVHVTVNRDGVSVEDSGDGIAPEEIERIFRRGYSGTQGSGIGIGLYLVGRICERLDWKIQVASVRTGGSRFALSFQPKKLTKR